MASEALTGNVVTLTFSMSSIKIFLIISLLVYYIRGTLVGIDIETLKFKLLIDEADIKKPRRHVIVPHGDEFRPSI